MRIEIIDPVWSRIIDKEDINKATSCLSYQKEIWKQGQYSKEKSKNEAYMINRGSGKFLTGLIPRIVKSNPTEKIEVEYPDYYKYFPEKNEPYLPNFTFRDDQIQTVLSVVKNQRGMIKNATGTGKTVIAGAICSVYPSSHIVFLCHTLDLLQQAKRAFTNQFGFKNVITLGGGSNQFEWNDEPTIVISTVQTFRNFDLLQHCDWIDIIIIDEAHHLTKKNSMIAEVLKQTLAPIRIGLSAELPKTDHGKLVLEGYLGPIIGEFTYQDGVNAGVLAIPLINLIPVPYSEDIGDVNHYNNRTEQGRIIKGMYSKGIIENKARNRLALLEASQSMKKGESVLILTGRDTQHGHILSKMARDIFDLDIQFVYGDTEKQSRQIAQDMLENKTIKCIISNVVWKEGINIKSLNHVINVGGEKYPIQIIGRGSRTTDNKKTVHITDFLDPFRWLSHHTVLRLIAYAENGWLDQYNLYTQISKL